jgi:hypothetical protein
MNRWPRTFRHKPVVESERMSVPLNGRCGGAPGEAWWWRMGVEMDIRRNGVQSSEKGEGPVNFELSETPEIGRR